MSSAISRSERRCAQSLPATVGGLDIVADGDVHARRQNAPLRLFRPHAAAGEPPTGVVANVLRRHSRRRPPESLGGRPRRRADHRAGGGKGLPLRRRDGARLHRPRGRRRRGARMVAAGHHPVRRGAARPPDDGPRGAGRALPGRRDPGLRPRRDGRDPSPRRDPRPLARRARWPAAVDRRAAARRRHRRALAAPYGFAGARAQATVLYVADDAAACVDRARPDGPGRACGGDRGRRRADRALAERRSGGGARRVRALLRAFRAEMLGRRPACPLCGTFDDRRRRG